jgi:predicted phage terminase large subunit-like protein
LSEELEFDPQDTEIAPQPGPQTILLAATDCQEIFFGGALMAGKSYALGLALEAQHQRHGGAVSGIIIRQSVPELADLIKTFTEILEPFGWEYRIGQRTFKHPDGAECRMRHLQDEKDIKKFWGHQYSFIGIDEMGDMGEKTFNLIQRLRAARLRSPKGVKVQFVATGNPCGAGHKLCKERYIDPAPPFTPFKDPRSKHNIIFIPGKMENNIKALLGDPEYRERCQSMGPQWYVDALVNGDWSISPEGNLFHREWFNNRFHLDKPPIFLFKVISWDTAFKTTKDSAESACTVWGVTESGFYLLEAWSAKVEFPALKRKAQDIHNSHSPVLYNFIEDKASGPTLVQSLKDETTIPLKAIKVDGDKQRRAFAITPYFESGRVFLPYSAPWLDKYIEQLCSFPAPTGFADLVDSTSQGINEIIKIKKRREKFGVNNNVVNLPVSIYGV